MSTFAYDKAPQVDDALLQKFLDDTVPPLRVLRVIGDGIAWYAGNGSPENVVTANIGSLYSRLDGGSGSTLYVKEANTDATGWAAV